MTLKKKLAISSIAILPLLTGCAMNGLPNPAPELPDSIVEGVEKIYAGIPFALAFEASRVRLDNEWALTAAHNELILTLTGQEYYIHPNCDVALVRLDGKQPNYKFGLAKAFKKVTHVGYPAYMPQSSGEGIYFMDVIVENYPECMKSMTTGSMMTGMSGGGVFNDKNELVGINHGWYNFNSFEHEGVIYDSPSVFVSFLPIIDWIEAITGKTYHIEGWDRPLKNKDT